jgi:hypothetical protein
MYERHEVVVSFLACVILGFGGDEIETTIKCFGIRHSDSVIGNGIAIGMEDNLIPTLLALLIVTLRKSSGRGLAQGEITCLPTGFTSPPLSCSETFG